MLYYRDDVGIISDNAFDAMVKGMLARWPSIEHRHKKHVTRGMLQAGTAHNLVWRKLPGVIHGAALDLRTRYEYGWDTKEPHYKERT